MHRLRAVFDRQRSVYNPCVIGVEDSEPHHLEGYKRQIRDFIARSFKGHELADDEDIFASGFVNSLFAMELVTFIEGTFAIAIENEDLDLTNFASVERISGLVERKLSASAGLEPQR